jgi:hypothetical protein
VPIPKPIFKLITVKVTGNVKLMAASSWVPNMPIKKVSTSPNVIRTTIPTIVGKVILRSVIVISLLSKSGGDVFLMLKVNITLSQLKVLMDKMAD